MTIEAPEPTGMVRGIAEAVVRAALGAIPVAGGAAVEVFQMSVSAGRDRRFADWIVQITETVNRLVLEPRGLALEDLATDDGFLDVITAATRAAVETSDEDKIAALRAAVVNSTCAPDTEADRRAILLGVLVDLTPTHIKLLKLFDDPEGWYRSTGTESPNVMMGSTSRVVQDAYPQLADDPVLLDHVAKDLEARNLAALALGVTMSGAGILQSRTRPLGRELLAFITEPAEPEPASLTRAPVRSCALR